MSETAEVRDGLRRRSVRRGPFRVARAAAAAVLARREGESPPSAESLTTVHLETPCGGPPLSERQAAGRGRPFRAAEMRAP